MTLRTVAAILEVFFCAAQDVLMEITLENGRKIGHFPRPIETFQCIKSNRNFDVDFRGPVGNTSDPHACDPGSIPTVGFFLVFFSLGFVQFLFEQTFLFITVKRHYTTKKHF
jgi:hypothetical protein